MPRLHFEILTFHIRIALTTIDTVLCLMAIVRCFYSTPNPHCFLSHLHPHITFVFCNIYLTINIYIPHAILQMIISGSQVMQDIWGTNTQNQIILQYKVYKTNINKHAITSFVSGGTLWGMFLSNFEEIRDSLLLNMCVYFVRSLLVIHRSKYSQFCL